MRYHWWPSGFNEILWQRDGTEISPKKSCSRWLTGFYGANGIFLDAGLFGVGLVTIKTITLNSLWIAFRPKTRRKVRERWEKTLSNPSPPQTLFLLAPLLYFHLWWQSVATPNCSICPSSFLLCPDLPTSSLLFNSSSLLGLRLDPANQKGRWVCTRLPQSDGEVVDGHSAAGGFDLKVDLGFGLRLDLGQISLGGSPVLQGVVASAFPVCSASSISPCLCLRLLS